MTNFPRYLNAAEPVNVNVSKLSNAWSLADRTNGRLCYSVASVVVVVCRLWLYVLWLNGAS